MTNVTANITIPDHLDFSDLRLSRGAGGITFDWGVITEICEASGISVAILRETHEDNVAGLIVAWYQAHLRHGGAHNIIADDLIAEAMTEAAAGCTVSHTAGSA